MMRVSLLPRLNALGTSIILEDALSSGKSPTANPDALDEHASLVSFAASGGARGEKFAVEMAIALRQLGRDAGFPKASGQADRAAFDQEAAIFLGESPALRTGEALRDDVWAFLATIMLPDLVTWRFPEKAAHRFEGGVRNAFQRLWMRGMVLDRGGGHEDRWLLVRSLTEDAMVQIFERPSIGGNRPLARAVAEAWLATSEEIGRGAMEPVMRRASKILRLKNEIVDLASLPNAELDDVATEIFKRARF